VKKLVKKNTRTEAKEEEEGTEKDEHTCLPAGRENAENTEGHREEREEFVWKKQAQKPKPLYFSAFTVYNSFFAFSLPKNLPLWFSVSSVYSVFVLS
jgi:hypothetical protein